MNEEIRLCKNCGTKLNNQDNFCENCGMAIQNGITEEIPIKKNESDTQKLSTGLDFWSKYKKWIVIIVVISIILISLVVGIIVLVISNKEFRNGNSIDKDYDEDQTLEIIEEIKESTYVVSKCDELGLYDIDVEIVNKKTNETSVDYKCQISYSDEYVSAKENIICNVSEWDDGWQIDSVKADSMTELEYSPIKFPNQIIYGIENILYNSSDGDVMGNVNVFRMPHVINDYKKSILFIYAYDDIKETNIEIIEQSSDIKEVIMLITVNVYKESIKTKCTCTVKCNLTFDDSTGLWTMYLGESNNQCDFNYNLNYEMSVNTEYGEKEKVPSVYYLNFKPEMDAAWQTLAASYEKQTGVKVTVVTAASGDYETTLQAEIETDDAPTLFQVNGPVGLANWKDYCYDLSGSDIYKELTSDAFALKDGSAVLGIGYVIESYGIITNKTLLDKAGYKVEDIKSFADLKKVAEDITARSDELGFAAFTSTGMDSSSDWRFKTHLANLPIYFEYQDEKINTTDAIKGTYLDNYRDIFDLYINNSTCEGKDLSAKTIDDTRNEFLNGKAVFYQNGSWEYSTLTEEGDFTDNDLAMIPVYVGVGDEANQGLCTGTENYWCVNKEADEEDIKATLEFINWCVTSEEGTKAMANDMGFVIPFNKAAESPNLFVMQDRAMTEAGKKPVTWTFTTMPSENWKYDIGKALIRYAANSTDDNWELVENAFVNGWRKE